MRGSAGEGENSCTGHDGELSIIRSPGNAVGQGSAAVGIGRIHVGRRGLGLRHTDRCRGAAPIGSDHRGLVDAGHGHRNRLNVGIGTIAGSDFHDVIISRVGVRWAFEIRGAGKGETTGGGVDAEFCLVRSTSLTEGNVFAVRIGRRYGGYRRLVLRHADRSSRPAAVGSNHRVIVVHSFDRDFYSDRIDLGAVTDLNDETVGSIIIGGWNVSEGAGRSRRARNGGSTMGCLSVNTPFQGRIIRIDVSRAHRRSGPSGRGIVFRHRDGQWAYALRYDGRVGSDYRNGHGVGAGSFLAPVADLVGKGVRAVGHPGGVVGKGPIGAEGKRSRGWIAGEEGAQRIAIGIRIIG